MGPGERRVLGPRGITINLEWNRTIKRNNRITANNRVRLCQGEGPPQPNKAKIHIIFHGSREHD